jgi:hypothetical protein
MAAFLQPGQVVRPPISPESVLRAKTPVDISDSYGPIKLGLRLITGRMVQYE